MHVCAHVIVKLQNNYIYFCCWQKKMQMRNFSLFYMFCFPHHWIPKLGTIMTHQQLWNSSTPLQKTPIVVSCTHGASLELDTEAPWYQSSCSIVLNLGRALCFRPFLRCSINYWIFWSIHSLRGQADEVISVSYQTKPVGDASDISASWGKTMKSHMVKDHQQSLVWKIRLKVRCTCSLKGRTIYVIWLATFK